MPPTELQRSGAWFTQPVIWLGIVLFTASLVGVVWLIAISKLPDDAALVTGKQVFGVPSRSVEPQLPR